MGACGFYVFSSAWFTFGVLVQREMEPSLIAAIPKSGRLKIGNVW
jgi:hypothetical protein